MVKRRSLPWAPNCVPDMRRQWCNALDPLVERQLAPCGAFRRLRRGRPAAAATAGQAG